MLFEFKFGGLIWFKSLRSVTLWYNFQLFVHISSEWPFILQIEHFNFDGFTLQFASRWFLPQIEQICIGQSIFAKQKNKKLDLRIKTPNNLYNLRETK